MREMVAYDAFRDEFIFRYDIMTNGGKEQHTVEVEPAFDNKPETLNKRRESASAAFKKMLDEKGLSWADVVEPPITKSNHYEMRTVK